MKLTSVEAKMLANLRSQQAAWRRYRWCVLIAGFLCGTAGVWLMFQVAHRAAASTNWDGEIVWVAPLPWVLFLQGLIICVLTLRKWHGDPLAQLLLRLFDGAGGAGDVPDKHGQ